jgi:2'-5' RNA ligase
MARRRLGIALVLPEPLASRVDGLRMAFADPALGRIAPHVTLVAPVNVNESEFETAIARLRATVAARTPLILTLGPVATFSPGRRVAYLTVSGPSLAELFELRAAVHEPPLYRDEARPFIPHITVCADAEPARIDAMVSAATASFGEARFDTVHVLENLRDDDGVFRWHVIDGAALRRSAVVGRGGLELVITTHEYRGLLELIARRDGDEIGRALIWLAGPRLVALEVVPAARSTGVGSHLLAAAEHEARTRGLTRLVADPHPFLVEHGWRPEAGQLVRAL